MRFPEERLSKKNDLIWPTVSNEVEGSENVRLLNLEQKMAVKTVFNKKVTPLVSGK